MASYKIGQTVETLAQQQGTIRYIGPIHVSEGTWLGIELSSATGKNDGSVRGERYFDCPAQHGLFVKEANILRVVSPPPPKPAVKLRAAAPAAAPAPAPTLKSRSSSIVSKRQSVVPATTRSTLRGPAPARKPSVANSTTTDSALKSSRHSNSSVAQSTTDNSLRTSRSGNTDALQIKIQHLEKQHAEYQEQLKEFTQAKDDRDKFNGIIQKLKVKCQTQHQEVLETKEQVTTLQVENQQLSKAQQEQEADYEIALLDKEMAEEKAEQAEAEIEALRARVEERDLELEILRSEAELLTTDMTEEDKEAAGFFKLQEENDRLREALIRLKEYAEEREKEHKACILELEEETSQVDLIKQTNASLLERLQNTDAFVCDLQQQVDASNEWEEMVEVLSSKNHDLEESVVEKDLVIKDLESLRELNEELELQRMEEADEMRAELEVKDSELAEHLQRLLDQSAVIEERDELITKFRELIFELQSRMADAESSKTMTETQVQETTGRFNQVMEMNRRLRTANVHATKKEISAQLDRLRGDELTEKLAVWIEVGSDDFSNGEATGAYFTAKRISFKASLLSSLFATNDRDMSHNGGLEEALARLSCVEAIYHLANIKNGSERLWSAMAVSTLSRFASFGPSHQEILAIEKVLDQGLGALKADEVNYADLAGSFGRVTKIQEALLQSHLDALAAAPEDEVRFRACSITANLGFLESNFAVVNTFLVFLISTNEELAEQASDVLEHFKSPSAVCSKAVLAANKLVKHLGALREDGMYPEYPAGLEALVQQDAYLTQVATEASQWAINAVKIVTETFNPDVTLLRLDCDLVNLLLYYWGNGMSQMSDVVSIIDEWNEYASVLMHSVEIVHGPAPWTEKAKEVESERRGNDTALERLQTLTAEHQITRLKLLERQTVIETKELEIEHLLKRHEEASVKIEDLERLHHEHTEAHEEIMRLQVQVRGQHLEIDTLKERIARSERTDEADQQLDLSTSVTGQELAEPVLAPRSPPVGFITLINALQDENHWLRQKEYADVFNCNLRGIFVNKRGDASPWEQDWADRLRNTANSMLSVSCVGETKDFPQTPLRSSKYPKDLLDPDFELGTPDAESTPLPSRELRSGRFKRSLPDLSPIQTSFNWQPSSSTHEPSLSMLERDSLMDLSPISEEFSAEMTAMLENFSEIVLTADAESFGDSFGESFSEIILPGRV
ncbi:hypothetical protein P153DRAFT_365449 [Dothidotthia symphoricarpi CBS 119687]|uniref:CAP-Gly domain-containing protein n=1 Tax=Dothidotthia symphoricarpi CBS 119687 TaxID=1392245 RepID=A0A6A6AK36_9PLEO|nr:uncharacterized protein P153DRAFT_365449 [Dothidotthia symphoricarpi CBS 119687]KAF2130801.1 hypothetical protein P153DRAFT_365449 [Dothidotthia symphoricarpi CBS 119687]